MAHATDNIDRDYDESTQGEPGWNVTLIVVAVIIYVVIMVAAVCVVGCYRNWCVRLAPPAAGFMKLPCAVVGPLGCIFWLFVDENVYVGFTNIVTIC